MSTSQQRVATPSSSGPDARPRTLPWLAARGAFGFAPAIEVEITQLGHDGWVAWQLDLDLVDDNALDQKLAAYPWVTMSAIDIINDPSMDTVELGHEYKGLRLLRAVESKRQLFERVCQFWEDHFNVYMGSYFRFVEDRTIWRPMALTNFPDLLRGVSTSASMISFLNNELNVVGAGNENLAREILELHTLGVDGPYTEADVREFARALTGWTFDDDRLSPSFGTAIFEPSLHDFGSKTILGTVYDQGLGQAELGGILQMLAMHPSTIDFVTGKMARFFLGDNAPPQTVENAKVLWLQTGGDIKGIVRELLNQRAVETVAIRGGTKFRRPFDWYASIFRSTGAQVPSARQNYDNMALLGQAPFEWAAPDGYPEDRERWVGLVAPRWKLAASFARPHLGGAWNHSFWDFFGLVHGVPRAGWARRLNQRLAGGRLSPVDVSEIQAHLDSLPAMASNEDLLGEALELVFASPSYQIV